MGLLNGFESGKGKDKYIYLNKVLIGLIFMQ